MLNEISGENTEAPYHFYNECFFFFILKTELTETIKTLTFHDLTMVKMA